MIRAKEKIEFRRSILDCADRLLAAVRTADQENVEKLVADAANLMRSVFSTESHGGAIELRAAETEVWTRLAC